MTSNSSLPPGILNKIGISGFSSVLTNPNYPLIVHSHLSWDWVWQRPQQFMSRFAKSHRVLFVEGPQVLDDVEKPYSTLHGDERFPNLTIMRTFFPRDRFHDGEWVDGERHRLLCEALSNSLRGKFENAVQWFYDPMAAPCFIGKVGEIANVYDCMDQLSQFKFAPPALVEREQILLKAADVVFAGGRKMWEDKRRTNSNSHFYGCGVDVQHFGTARLSSIEIPEDVANLPGPVYGYFGVVDERLDYELIAQLADENSEGSVVIVGPFCKIDVDALPQRPNLHWLGGRDYKHLPGYTAAFDVCLMPFALNEATEYINPTKALEYMATGTPIVSTAVADVVSNFGEVVDIARSAEQFAAMCRQAAENPDNDRIRAGLQMASDNTWESIVESLNSHVLDALLAGSDAYQLLAASESKANLSQIAAASAQASNSAVAV